MREKSKPSLIYRKSGSNGPASVSDLISSIVKSQNLAEKAEKFDFFDSWPQVVGKELCKNTRPIKLDKGVLTIEAADAAYIQELSLRQSEIKSKISELGHSGLVASLRFISGNPKNFISKKP